MRLKDFHFEGTTGGENWETFKSMSVTVCGGRRVQDNQKMVHLISLLQGEPKEIAKQVAGDEYDTESYLRDWAELEEQYRGEEKAQRQYYYELKAFPKLQTLTSQNLLTRKSLIGIILARFETARAGFAESGMINLRAQKVIPQVDLLRYHERLGDICRRDTLREFYNFLEAKRKILRIAELCQKGLAQQVIVANAEENDDQMRRKTSNHEAKL